MESGSAAIFLNTVVRLIPPARNSIFFPTPISPDLARSGNSSGLPARAVRRQRLLRPRCNKMFVPGFGEGSPEARAARNLQDFFTFLAVRIVLAQLQSYNPEAHAELLEFVNTNSLSDGDDFCRALMRQSSNHKALALRVMEVRSAYSKKDFEWENMKKLAFKMVDESNTALMREYIIETSHMDKDN